MVLPRCGFACRAFFALCIGPVGTSIFRGAFGGVFGNVLGGIFGSIFPNIARSVFGGLFDIAGTGLRGVLFRSIAVFRRVRFAFAVPRDGARLLAFDHIRHNTVQHGALGIILENLFHGKGQAALRAVLAIVAVFVSACLANHRYLLAETMLPKAPQGVDNSPR